MCGRGSGIVSQERRLEQFLRWTMQEMGILVRGKSMGKAQKYEEVFPGNTKWLAPGDKSSGRGDWRGEQRLGLASNARPRCVDSILQVMEYIAKDT